MEENKYLSPDYEDDDDDDLDDYDEDIDEDGEEEAIENYLDNNQKRNNSTMTTTPFGNTTTPWGSNPSQTPTWGSNPNNTSSPWGSNNSPGFWGSNNNPNNSWQRPSWGSSGSGWNSSSGSNWNIGEKKSIDRNKRIIFCDILDCLVETYQSNGKPGLLPRGIYDIRFRFDVWDKLACFNPEKIFAMVPRSLLNSSNEVSWRALLEYVVCSLSEYLRAPYHVCQVLLQTEIGQPKENMMMQVLDGLDKNKIIQIGVNSGLYGQNNRDQVAANICGIDYIDLSTFMNSYF